MKTALSNTTGTSAGLRGLLDRETMKKMIAEEKARKARLKAYKKERQSQSSGSDFSDDSDSDSDETSSSEEDEDAAMKPLHATGAVLTQTFNKRKMLLKV